MFVAVKENKNSFDQLLKNLRERKTEGKTSDSDNADDIVFKPSNSLFTDFDHVGPSTSKGVSSTFSRSDTMNEIDVDEIKVELSDGQLDVEKNKDNDGNESTNSEELFPVTKNRFKRAQRLNFEESESSDEVPENEIPFVNVKMEDDSDDPAYNGE